MVQPASDPRDHSADIDHEGDLIPTRPSDHLSTEFSTQSARRPASGPQISVGTRAIRQLVVLEVADRLSDVVEELDRAIQLALAEGPSGLVCDLSAVLEGAEPGAVEVLATAGRHVRDWPGIPVAMVCSDPRVRDALTAHTMGVHLIVTASMLPALSAVRATPIPVVGWLHLAPHPTAPRASRIFVTRTLMEWGLGPLIPSACLVVSELVTNSTVHAGTDIVLSVAWSQGGLRLTVRDNSPDLPRLRYSPLDVHGRGLRVVTGLSRAFGVLPTADGGKVVWAVLSAAQAYPTASPRHAGPATTTRESPIFTGAHVPG